MTEEQRDEGKGLVLIVPPHAVEPCHVKGRTMMKVSLGMTAEEAIAMMMTQKADSEECRAAWEERERTQMMRCHPNVVDFFRRLYGDLGEGPYILDDKGILSDDREEST